MSHDEYRKECREAVQQFARSKSVDAAIWGRIEQNTTYVQGDYGSSDDHAKLANHLAKVDASAGTAGNRLFYLSTPPNTFEPIISCLGERLPQSSGDSKSSQRVIIEKPFGRDLASARTLNTCCINTLPRSRSSGSTITWQRDRAEFDGDAFCQRDVRADMDYKYIDHVQITVSETLGRRQPGGYYDKSGALRDMVQNHIFQLLLSAARALYWLVRGKVIDRVGPRPIGRIDLKPTFSSRMLRASSAAGGPALLTASNWKIWFCTMSRSAPLLCNIPPGCRRPASRSR